ncbi:hypothetical protein EX895_002886 [Sporisorium graminicola]|uniref:Asl1-like glycosyl hydrolase catalytic domain-containing protein n=1 Tax=Sporisorium graminicola TaxID=280036 RepID=A0A4U7KVH1_9BASI|nr:hypothetical protein EX895_002886 [Sporisorium graminicola]TKY88176.1 hypothetical protein EX895_002886 [Sporisorium graminicola]
MKLKLGVLTSIFSLALVVSAEAKKHHHHRGLHKEHEQEHEHENKYNAPKALELRSDESYHLMGLPWGCDPNCFKGLKSTRHTDITFYHHWQDGCVPELDKLGFEYVPTFWGPTKWSEWEKVKAELRHRPQPKYMLACNEPDVQGQADLGPQAAARLWMQELKPFADKGVQVGSPQVCWNMQWLEQFMSECHKLGCNISFIALHWYGSWHDFDKFTHWISSVHDAFHLPIWITEYGITQASGGSQHDIKDFHVRAVQWMRQQGYVKRSAWLGGFPVNQKPDPYPSSLNSYFNDDGSARDLLWWASHSGGGNSWLNLPGISKRKVAEEALNEKAYKDDDVKHHHQQYDEDHCDYKCQLREASLEKHHRKRKGFVYVDEKQVCVATPSKLDKEERRKLSTCFKQAGFLGRRQSVEVSEGHHEHTKVGTLKHDNTSA